MDYEFFFAKTASVHMHNAPRLADADLLSIAKVMERNGRYYGSKIRIHAIGIRSDYLSPTAPMRMLYLNQKNQNARGERL